MRGDNSDQLAYRSSDRRNKLHNFDTTVSARARV